MKQGVFLRACLLVVFLLSFVPSNAQARTALPLSAYDCTAQSDIFQVECFALVALYNSTNGAGWTNSTGWLANNTPCAWFGVGCDAGHVNSLSLYGNHLSGSIPAEIGNLSWLQYLLLSNNQLSGSIPQETGSLTQLIVLNVAYNQLNGGIPAQLGNLAQLRNLYLGGNHLSGSIPAQFGNLSQLLLLNLTSNNLSGTIPAQLGNLTNLQYLSLFGNQMTGSIPPELGNLAQLQELILAANQLSGSIPVELANLSQLINLSLGYNQLSGGIPAQLGNLTLLQTLSLYENPLGGSIPAQLGNLAQLQELNLNHNQLSGGIPVQLGSLSQLRYLSLNDNQITGSIPVQLGNLSQLRGLNLYSNQLSGSIPAELGNLSNLQQIALFANQLSGSIPVELGSLTQLQNLWLSFNQLSGSIPAEFGNLTSLQSLDLKSNQLSGSIPAALGNLNSLRYLELESNQLSGGIPAALGRLANLQHLALSMNQLSGSIPAELGNLTILNGLYLNFNQLSGGIPAQLGNLTQLSALNLASNPLLRGALPPSLVNLPLGLFYFVNTQLCEPEDTSFQTWLGSISSLSRSNVSCAVILLPGIMGSRLTNAPANADCADDFFRTFGEVWFRLDKVLGLGTLVLKPDGHTSQDGCNVISASGIMDETGMFDAYGPFVKDLTRAGYTVRSFPYDWRLSLEESAEKLDAQIDDWGYGNVTLVGHSMGGLLARVYVSDPNRASKVDRVISVGTPYWGAPTIALNMRGGWLPLDFKIGDRSAALPVVADIIRNSPGSMQLLPSNAYFQVAGEGYYQDDDQALTTYAATKNFYTTHAGKRGTQNGALIDAAAAFHARYDDFSQVSVDYDILAGNHLPTRSFIREYPCSFMFLPDTCYEIQQVRMGDDTVPDISASAGQTTRLTTFGPGEITNSHGDLMKDPAILTAVKNILAGSPPKLAAHTPKAAATPAPFLQVSVLGSAQVKVTDSAGHFSGIDGSGTAVNGIPGATFDALGSQTEVVLPSGQVYTLTLKQTSGYPLEMKVSELRAPTDGDPFTPHQRAVFVEIPSSAGGVATLVLDLSAGLDSLVLQVDQDNNGTQEQTLPPTTLLDAQQTQDVTMPVTTIHIQEAPGSDGYYAGTISASANGADSGTGVLKTEYSLDGGHTWLVYQGPASIDTDNVHVLYVRSIDNAGNYEYPWPSLRLRPEQAFLPVVIH